MAAAHKNSINRNRITAIQGAKAYTICSMNCSEYFIITHPLAFICNAVFDNYQLCYPYPIDIRDLSEYNVLVSDTYTYFN